MALYIKHDLESRIIEWHNEHAYSNNNETYFPSVTTILGIIAKGEHLIKWYQTNGLNANYLMREAQDFGKKIHRLTEEFDTNLDKPINVREYNADGKVVFEHDNRTWEFLSRYIDFRKRFPIKILAIEQSLCSETLKVGGTIDRVFELNGERYLVDLKTGPNIYKEYSLQLYAYKLLWDEFFPNYGIDKIAIMHLDSGTHSFGKKDDIQGYGWKLKTIPLDIPYLKKGWDASFNLFDWDSPDWKPFFQKYPDHYCAAELGIKNNIDEAVTQ